MKNKVGVERTVDEIKLYVEQHKVRIDKGSSALRNALFSLKKENPALINVRRGVYIWKEENVKEKDNTVSKYDFSDFIRIFFLICLHTGADVHTPWCKIFYCFFYIFPNIKYT